MHPLVFETDMQWRTADSLMRVARIAQRHIDDSVYNVAPWIMREHPVLTPIVFVVDALLLLWVLKPHLDAFVLWVGR